MTGNGRTSFSVGAGVLMLLCAGCGDSGPTSPSNGNVSDTSHVAAASFSFETAIANRTRLTLRAVNGTIEVDGRSEASSIVVRGERRVGSESAEDAQANLARLQVRMTDPGGEVLVETVQPEDTGGRQFVVDYRITLPRNLEVSVDSVNGTIAIENIQETVSLNSVNGAVELRQIAGSAFVQLVNGEIGANIAMPAGGAIELSTVNGNVDLEVPRSTSARLTARVTNGTITVSDLVLAAQSTTPISVTGTLGSGNGTISLTTVNGNVTVRGF